VEEYQEYKAKEKVANHLSRYHDLHEQPGADENEGTNQQ